MSWSLADAKNSIDRAYKNYVTPQIWEKTHLREIFNGTLIFQQSSMICIGHHVGGHTLPSNMAAKTTSCLYLVKRLIVTLRCALNVTTSCFQHFPWSCVQKKVIHNFNNPILVTWPATNLLILRKWCRFEKPNCYYFV